MHMYMYNHAFMEGPVARTPAKELISKSVEIVHVYNYSNALASRYCVRAI